ncbi:hypothetical protein BRC73_02055 [Halobacteriales archaeon QH_7_66_37]|nr:MAG: hypothetical protein BRC73_02055 [Halobacteriales archaeon QH_7_66_37]
MAEFNLQPRLDAAGSEAGDAVALLTPYVEEDESVAFGEDSTDATEHDGVLVPDAYLEIDGVEVFAEIYTALTSEPSVVDVGLWGPTAERFPVRVQHYALQQISQPDLYEFHALDSKVTLVIAESKLEAEEVQREVPVAALG